MFKKATKQQARLRLALVGPAGSGKTYSALQIATHLGGRIAVVDSEHGSASKYADLFEFDACELESFHPNHYIEAIEEAQRQGYEVLIIDSLSHAWIGKDGALDLVNKASKRNNNNSFVAWADVTPLQNRLVDTILSSRLHVIVTLRSKVEHVVEKDKDGKTVVRKVGMQPVQREGLEFEFDLVGDLDQDNTLIVSKSRCPELSKAVISHPGKQVAQVLLHWLSDGEPLPESNQSKCDRVRAAREAVGLESEAVKALIQKHYNRKTPSELSSEQVDELVELIGAGQNGKA